MTQTARELPSHKSLTLLSQLLLDAEYQNLATASERPELKRELTSLTRNQFDDLVSLAQSNHVIVRGLGAFLELMLTEKDLKRAQWAKDSLHEERKRIDTAMKSLAEIVAAFGEHDCDVTVIKSLDHWPDLGSDLDLYTNASPEDVFRLMNGKFGAAITVRSWGDRLANKWNFVLPGLPELVEVHMGRLGQTGEQVVVASSLATRNRQVSFGGRLFPIPSNSDRVMISTLQRMYRHFYIRLCDIVDIANLADAGDIDYQELRFLAQAAGIWEGVATYLAIISDYVESFRGSKIDLRKFVTASARFRGEEVRYDRGFLRIPIVPQSARLYGSQLAGVLARGELTNGARLSLLPWLAAAAVVGQKITGSDKGIW